MNHRHPLIFAVAIMVSAASGCEDKSSTKATQEPAPAKSAAAESGSAKNERVDTGAMGPDGLPVEIPAPGSTPPTVAEWNAVTKEVTVKGSSALGCETKMLREWLRVSCNKKGTKTPTGVKTESSGGQQAYVGLFGTTASAVVQVVKGKDYSARYEWDDSGGTSSSAKLSVSWPSDQPRPVLTIQ